MKKNTLVIPVIALIIGVLSFLWFSSSALSMRPDITLTAIDGQKFSLAKMSGKPILINFWATSCPSCVEEIPHLSALYKELHDDGLEIIGVAMFYDPPQHVKNFTDQNQLPYPIAIDIQGEAAQAFGDILLTPTNFLIDPDGRIVKKKIGLMDIHALRQDILAMLNKPTDTP